MNTSLARTPLFFLVSLGLASTAMAQVPDIPDPSTYPDDWGNPTTKPYFNQTGGMGHTWTTTGTTTIKTRTGTGCAQLPLKACGGNIAVSVGASVTLFGVTLTASQGWTSDSEDKCKLCAVFLCATVKQTQRETTGTTTYSHGGSSPYHDGPHVTSIPDPTTAALKQVCLDTDEARAYCCPDSVATQDSDEGYLVGEFVDWGTFTTIPDQFGIGSLMPEPMEVDLMDIAAVVEMDLRLPSISASEEWGPGPHAYQYAAGTANGLSYGQRMELAEHLISVLDLFNTETPWPTGRILLSLTEDGGGVRTVDLGTLEEIAVWDSLRLTMPADVNMDRVVNEQDFDLVQAYMLTPGTLSPGDVNLDGWVDDLDLQFVAERFTN